MVTWSSIVKGTDSNYLGDPLLYMWARVLNSTHLLFQVYTCVYSCSLWCDVTRSCHFRDQWVCKFSCNTKLHTFSSSKSSAVA